MPQSPELAGGEGFTFEGDAAAFYLTSLLAEAGAPGIDDRVVVGVSLQQRDFGEPLDDVIVDFEDRAKNSARLSLQVKRSLTISDAKTNADFRDIIRDSWATFKKPDFRIDVDRYGAAVGTISPTKERALKALCDWARESLTTDHFDARFSSNGNASEGIRSIRADVVALLEEVGKEAPCTAKEIHQFLAHFVLIQFDFLREGATDPPKAINRIRECLASEEASNAPLVWSKIVQLARSSAGKSGQFDRARLVRMISPVARLRGANSIRPTLDRLTEISRNYANLIPDDIDGTKLDRLSLLGSLDAKIANARLVQIRGLPGSGKSVVMRRAVQRAMEKGPTIFLKAEQLEGTSWASYATSHGLDQLSLEELLVEIGATGTPILFIDAIDRIEKEHQPVILELFRIIIESPSLEDWRIVVSLRDTGIELLRNWLGEFLRLVSLDTLEVNELDDNESEILASAKPHLRPLLFGGTTIQAIVRRPFFAKILNQNYVSDPSAPPFAPQSEVDLIENWWLRGGYNESGQSAFERQQVLMELARFRARELGQPIRLRQLTSITHIENLRSDGILQNVREGISVRFAHDIFFEWAFFHVLADSGSSWIDEIKSCGEPPAVARVVELASQREYDRGSEWRTNLALVERPDIRSQWLRAWLVAPFGTARFEVDENQFAIAAFADEFRLLRKAFVWFQAEKTTPNTNILLSSLPLEQRQRIADLLGWPSDFLAWRRLIGFVLRRILEIPHRLYPEVVAIFEVWQNAFSSIRNAISQDLLKVSASWLAEMDSIDRRELSEDGMGRWDDVSNIRGLRKSLEQLILRSAGVEPNCVVQYFDRLIDSERLQNEHFEDIIAFSPTLVQALPGKVVELSLAFLCQELPDEVVARVRQERIQEAEYRKAILAKPESERTRGEKMMLSNVSLMLYRDELGDSSWKNLSIRDDHRSYWPPSPLREPFQSLFRFAPNEALRLFRELCNHAMTAWRQMHRHSRERKGNPIPLELKFPWGNQIFWGTDREYLWSRSNWAPKAIGCGFMALEDWCFAELKRGRDADGLIQQIVEGNQCIAILGTAATIALHAETVSEVTFPLFTSQRLLAADHIRWAQERHNAPSLIGFDCPDDKAHIEAVKLANSRPVRNTDLRQKVPMFIFGPTPIRDHARDAIRNFINDLPFQYEEHRGFPDVEEELREEAIRYSELADTDTYKAYRASENSDQIMIVHESPSATTPENVARVEEATRRLTESGLWLWASKSLEERALGDSYAMEDAIALAKGIDGSDLFEPQEADGDMMASMGSGLQMRRGGVAATAAVVLNFREGSNLEDLEWARLVLERAIRLPEKPSGIWCPQSIIPWHQAIYVARGLGADLREGTAAAGAVRGLFSLIAHPLESVSLAAIEESCKLWSKNPQFAWAALVLAFSLCQMPPRSRAESSLVGEMLHSPSEAQDAIDQAVQSYEAGGNWHTIPLPPPAWLKKETGGKRRKKEATDKFDTEDEWVEPDGFWHSKQASEILKRIPIEEILNGEAKVPLLSFLEGVLDWTNQKHEPPWAKSRRRDHSADRMFEWTHTLGSKLGQVAGLLPIQQFQPRFLDPILRLEAENCWALLTPFVDSYVCAYIYDAKTIPSDASATLDVCLGRFLKDSVFDRKGYRSGEFSGFDQPKLARVLMFVSIERADLAARYVNGDWSEINLILPIVDRFIRAAGWAASVMGSFLTLCERSKDHYPAAVFAEQILATIVDDPGSLKGWSGTFIPARIAELVQHFAHRDAPMTLDLAQKLLRILDLLVDMGDRRSAALQLGESFREIRLSSEN